jgi:3-oxoacyl-[acyl-carrier protein] reductase
MAGLSDLCGKVALVTGASRGIGRAIAVALTRAGADVAVNYRSRVDAARETADSIAALGRRGLLVAADVSVAAEVTRLVAEVEVGLGPVDILVNNAGAARPCRWSRSRSGTSTRWWR